MSSAANLHVRRVGFRDGTDEELTALNAVEVPIAAECGSNRMPAPLESYKAFARNLPSQLDDHAWLVETSDRIPIAAGFCWSNAAGHERVMECDVLVLPESRRQGIASRLLAAICEQTSSEGRSLLTWSTYDAVPAGEAVARRIGARVARVDRTSELVLGQARRFLGRGAERWGQNVTRGGRHGHQPRHIVQRCRRIAAPADEDSVGVRPRQPLSGRS